MSTAKLTELHMENGSKARIYDKVPACHLHAESGVLEHMHYKWIGELPIEQVRLEDKPVVIDAIACQVRHQEDGALIRLRNGQYKHKGVPRSYKVIGIVRGERLFVVTELSEGTGVADIAPRRVMRAAGVTGAVARISKRTAVTTPNSDDGSDIPF